MKNKNQMHLEYNCKNCRGAFRFKHHANTHTFCSLACAYDFRAKTAFSKYLEKFKQGILTKRAHIYKVLVHLHGDKCAECGITEWNEKPIRLWVDHKDGDAGNNSPTNLRLMCPNCDSQSATFGAKNKGNGRKSRGMKMYD